VPAFCGLPAPVSVCAPDAVRSYLGDSRGHWEGDTLVVETTNLRRSFLIASDALRLTERFTRRSHDELEYEVTIDDPRTYTRKWKSAWTLHWVPGDIAEQFCETGRN
jgi:hypothetical protein